LAAILVSLAVPANAEEGATPKESGRTAAMTDGAHADIAELELPVASHDPSVAQASCNWSASLEMTGYYFLGFLNQAVGVYDNEVNCSYGISDFIFNTARLRYYDLEVSSASDNCDQAYCTHTLAAATYHCEAGGACAGDYFTEADFSIFLTGGYYWPEPAPPGCTIGGPGGDTALFCSLTVGPVNVPLTDF
jgi:hypothetical protein